MTNLPLPRVFSYESMGTTWKITIWDSLEEHRAHAIEERIQKASHDFDHTYSRFIKDSLVTTLSTQTGEVEVPDHFMAMLHRYRALYLPTQKKLNPLIGFTISDLGYDAEYSLTPRTVPRATPDLFETVTITGPHTIVIQEPVLFDFGALGKGYFVDRIADILKEAGLRAFLVDGSGDIFYSGETADGPSPITVGLEDPSDPRNVIGVLSLKKGSVCASAINRRTWSAYHHVIDPGSNTSPEEITATWVVSDTAEMADALASCLFFVPPEALKDFSFEYCILNKERKLKSSPGFTAELF